MAERTIQDLWQMQGLPLSAKVKMTQQRIRDWVYAYGEDGVYVSFSGGKDSTVLLHLVRELYPNVRAVFVDTGLEYPEIRQFVKTFDNVEWLKPKLTFKQVIQKYGYPFISKEVAECVYGARKYLTSVLEQASLDRQTDRQSQRIATDLSVCADLESTANFPMPPLKMGGVESTEIPLRIREAHGDRKIFEEQCTIAKLGGRSGKRLCEPHRNQNG